MVNVWPAQGQSEQIRFAVVGDYGYGDRDGARRVASMVRGWNPDFVITVGDNNYPDGEAATIDRNVGQLYHSFIHPYRGSYGGGADRNRFFPAIGNHDFHSISCSGSSCSGPHQDYFQLPGNERYYDFVWGPVHFFVLSSYRREPDGNTPSSTQARWLRSRLQASEACWNVVYLHHAPYSSGRHGDDVDLQWPYKEWGADVVLAGHDHDYERIVRNGLTYFVNGLGGGTIRAFDKSTAGSQVRFTGTHGAQRVEAQCGEMTLEFITVDGRSIDRVTLTKTVIPREPVARFGTLQAEQEGAAAEVRWTTTTEALLTHFDLEEAPDGRAFTRVAQVEARNAPSTYTVRLDDRPAGRYTYRVRWFGDDERSGLGPTTALTVQRAAVTLGAPRAVQTDLGQLRVQWTTSEETYLDRFVVELTADDELSTPNAGVFAPVAEIEADGSPSTYTVDLDSLTSGPVRVRVAWVGRDGDSGTSEEVRVTLLGSAGAVDSLAAWQTDIGRLRVRWASQRERYLERYRIELAGENDVFQPLVDVAPRNEPTVYARELEGLSPGRYRVRVAWVGRDGVEDATQPVRTVVLGSDVTIDSLQAVQVGVDSVAVSWTTVRELFAEGFVLEESVDGDPFQSVRSLPARGTPGRYRIVLEDRKPKEFAYRLRWTGRDDRSETTEPVGLTVVLSTVAFGPAEAEQAGDEILLHWTTTAEEHLRLFILEQVLADGSFVPETTFVSPGAPSVYTHRVDDVEPGTYRFRVRWIGEDGRNGVVPLPEVLVRSFVEWGGPVQAVQEGETVRLTWATSRELGTRLFRLEASPHDGAAFLPVDSVEALPDADAGARYTYRWMRPDWGMHRVRVRWLGVDGNSESTVPQPITVAAGVEIRALTGTLSNGIVELAWEAADEVYLEGYTVEQARDGGYVEIGTVPVGAGVDSVRTYRFTVPHLENDTYRFRVRGVGPDGPLAEGAEVVVVVDHVLAVRAPYPNPAAWQIRLPFSLPRQAALRVDVVDVLGRVVAQIEDAPRPAGPGEVVISVRDWPSALYQARFFIDGVQVAQRPFVVGH